MFTGLIQTVGEVISARAQSASPHEGSPVRLTVRPGAWDYRPALGDSIAVDGCCLTVADQAAGQAGMGGGTVSFDVIPQTLKMTALGRLRAGSRVNLEHAARMDTLMGGHMVQGHVDGLGRVVRVDAGDGGSGEQEYRIRIAPAPGLMEFAIPKGSVTVMGVSLTLAEVEPHGGEGGNGEFEVALIPTTLDETNLGELVAGDNVNLEMDVMAKTVVHWMRHYGGGGVIDACARH